MLCYLNIYIRYLSSGRSSSWKTVTEVLKMLSEAAGSIFKPEITAEVFTIRTDPKPANNLFFSCGHWIGLNSNERVTQILDKQRDLFTLRDLQIELWWYKLTLPYRVLKLQKRAARVILDDDSQASSVKLFNKLNWIPFFEQAKVTKCCIIYKRLQGHVPTYLKSLLKLTRDTQSRQTRYANFNIARPFIKRKTEGGRIFIVTACQAWNGLPLYQCGK